MTEAPITDAEFAALMVSVGVSEDAPPAVACSGGPDSMALAFLCRNWARARGLKAKAAIVNHGLRPEAGDEAARVADALLREGVDAVVLGHHGPRPTRDIQAAAREIRYTLLAEWLTGLGHDALLLAHHLEDQAETVLLRLARGSGVDGLSAMAPRTERDGISLLRPLLALPKARLAATVAASGWPVEADPSNRDRAFARVRMRDLTSTLAAEGLTPARLADTASRLARARRALDAARDGFLREHATLDPSGYATVRPEPLADMPEEVGLRVLSHLIRVLGARAYPPREEKLVALHRAVTDRTIILAGRTLAGARIAPWRGTLLICREQAGIVEACPPRATFTWDGRFRVSFSDSAVLEGLSMGKLGRDGVTRLRDRDAATKQALAALPGAVRPTLPALWRGSAPLSVPHLGLAASDAPRGTIAYRPLSDTWGEAFRRPLPFSSRGRAPI